VIKLVEVKNNRTVLNKFVVVAEDKPSIVVGIPAYNEEKTIAKVVLQAKKYTDKVVVCDDGSSDLTGEIAEHMGADVVRHAQNLGYGVAIQSLFRRARELGADGQHDSREVPNVVKPSWRVKRMWSLAADLLMSVRLMLCRGIGGLA